MDHWVAAREKRASRGRFAHIFLPEDPEEAHLALSQLVRGKTAVVKDGEVGGDYDQARMHDLVAEGGFSHHPTHGAAPSTGFMASYHAPEGSGVATVHHLSDLTPEHIGAHRNAVNEHLSKPDSYQGGWVDRAEDKVYLDASRHFDKEPDVRKFAVQQKQKAYFDLHDFSEKYLHPKLDPDSMKDEGAWRQKYAHLPEHEREDPPAGYSSYSHLYPPTEDQKAHWEGKGHRIGGQRASEPQIPIAPVLARSNPMAGRPVGPWRNDQWVQEQLKKRHGR